MAIWNRRLVAADDGGVRMNSPAESVIVFQRSGPSIRAALWGPSKHIDRTKLPSNGDVLTDQVEDLSREESERQGAEMVRRGMCLSMIFIRVPPPSQG